MVTFQPEPPWQQQPRRGLRRPSDPPPSFSSSLEPFSRLSLHPFPVRVPSSPLLRRVSSSLLLCRCDPFVLPDMRREELMKAVTGNG